jgi:predicted RecA/RadA family phage recombinase
MKNFVQRGDTVTLTAPYDVASGAGLQVGSLFGVASFAAASTKSVEAVRIGVFDLAKVSAQAWAMGDRIYWDNTAKLCTTVATGNLLVGSALLVASNPSATGRVLLDGSADRRQVLQATGNLNFPNIGAAASSDLTIAVAGAVVGDPVALALPAAPQAGLVFMAFVSAADTVTVRAMNITGAGVDAAAADYTVAVVKV